MDSILTLQNAFDFDEEDLTANRYGQLSKRQLARYRLLYQINSPRMTIAPMWIGLILIIIGSLWAVLTSNLMIGIGLGLPFAITSFALINNFKHIWKINAAIESLYVSRTCGFIQNATLDEYEASKSQRAIIETNDNLELYKYIQVNEVIFRVTFEQHKILDFDKPYCIYYEPQLHRILAVEPISTKDLAELESTSEPKPKPKSPD